MMDKPISQKPLFNLSLVVQETGIKPDTLRAWERRYELPAPSRTEGGHRLFSQYDIETIKWLLARQEEGMRISQAVDYWRELIAAGIDPVHQAPHGAEAAAGPSPTGRVLQPLGDLLQQWLEYSLVFDEEQAELVLDTAFTHYPWETVLTDLIFPAMAEIGERWYTADITVQQEHYASELVIRKLQALIDAAPQPFHPQKALICCPAGEFHTIAPLALNLLLRYRGWEIIYLGADVPADHLEDSLVSIQPSLVIMTAVRLKTCAALLDASEVLRKYNTPLAFAGHVFTENPQLVDRIPGTYLGRDLGNAASIVEKMLSAPDLPADPPPPSNPYQAIADQIIEKLPYLESAAMFTPAGENVPRIPASVIRYSNQYLFEDLQAALVLGDLGLLKPNIAWAKGLLQSRDFDPAILRIYLENFSQVARNVLGEDAQPLQEWLTESTASLFQNEGIS